MPCFDRALQLFFSMHRTRGCGGDLPLYEDKRVEPTSHVIVRKMGMLFLCLFGAWGRGGIVVIFIYYPWLSTSQRSGSLFVCLDLITAWIRLLSLRG